MDDLDDLDVLGTLIRSSRLDKGLSLGQLASAVNRSPSSVRRWERGEAVPSREILPALASALDIDEADLASLVDGGRAVQPASDPEIDVTEDVPKVTEDVPKVRTTIEDDEILTDAPNYFETPTPEAIVPPPRQPSKVGRASSAVWKKRDSWIGWVRGFLTALALLFLFMGLVWAFGELVTALKDVLGSFSIGG